MNLTKVSAVFRAWTWTLAAIAAVVLLSYQLDSQAAQLPPRYDHVVIVMEENRTPTEIIGDLANAPYITSLASGGVRLGSMYAIIHPSQPNYMELFSGANQGVADDNLPPNFSTTPTATYPFRTANLGAELIAAGFTFAGFSEEIESAAQTQPLGKLGRQGSAAARQSNDQHREPCVHSVPFRFHAVAHVEHRRSQPAPRHARWLAAHGR
jgi:hypothetical protein